MKFEPWISFPTFLLILGFSSCIPPINGIPPDPRSFSGKHSDILQVGMSLPYFIDYTRAMEKLNLSDTMQDAGPFTFFIPNAHAFAVFLNRNNISDITGLPPDLAKNLLLNHIIRGRFLLLNLSTGYYPSLATETTTGNNLDLYLQNDGLFELNGTLCMGTPDIPADNGMIHSITAMIPLPTVADHISVNDDFSLLHDILERRDLSISYDSLLRSDGPFTLFAPDNEAFTACLGLHQAWPSVNDIPARDLSLLMDRLLISTKNILLKNITSDSLLVSRGSDTLHIGYSHKTWIIQGPEHGQAKILTHDIQAVNGVIQEVDCVWF